MAGDKWGMVNGRSGRDSAGFQHFITRFQEPKRVIFIVLRGFSSQRGILCVQPI